MSADSPLLGDTRFGVAMPAGRGERPPIERVGPYRIVSVLGEGGMGVVYLAEQDAPVKREVALKILRAGANTKEIVARFETERRALALMDHPNITRVLDAGETESGLPYFVMERVQGIPITDYAARERLATRSRVRLFIQVCRAVQHAHQKGIIHRDIKPSNVLVTETDGVPLVKVIDFGIAKAIAPAADARLTATGMAIGTPAYMSPEQFTTGGEDIDTRCDIYSMGVLLYELVAGVLPFEAEGGGWAALFARRTLSEVRPPSAQYAALGPETRTTVAEERGTDPDTLRQSLRGDLDCVILKALDRDRDQRYETANALAGDLENYLENKPVSARPASAVYRARKFARRHRAAVMSASAFLLLLVAVAIGATIQARRLAHARAVAVARQGQAEELIGFMLGDLRDTLRSIGKLDLLERTDEKAMKYFAAVPTSELSAEELDRRAQALQGLAEIRRARGRIAEATALMNQSLEIARLVAARDSTNPRWQITLMTREYDAGLTEWQQGNLDAALRHLQPYLRISDRLIQRYPDSLAFRAARAYALNNVGFVQEGKGDIGSALASYQGSLAILKALVERDPANRDWQIALGGAYNATAVAQRKLGDLRGALGTHRAELAHREALAAREPGNMELPRYPATSHAYLGDLLLWTGDVDGALAEMRAADSIWKRLVANDPENVDLRLGLAQSERRIAQAELERGGAQPALAALAESRAQLERILVASPGNVRARRELVTVEVLRGRAMQSAGRLREALALLPQAAAAADSALHAKPEDWEWRKLSAGSHLALSEAQARTGAALASRVSAQQALAVVDSTARATRATDMLALQAGALAAAGHDGEARIVAAELSRRGYRLPSFMALLSGQERAGAH